MASAGKSYGKVERLSANPVACLNVPATLDERDIGRSPIDSGGGVFRSPYAYLTELY